MPLIVGLQYPDNAETGRVAATIVDVRASFGPRPAILLDPNNARTEDFRLIFSRMGFPVGDLPSGGGGENVDGILALSINDGLVIPDTSPGVGVYGAMQYATEYGFGGDTFELDESNTTIEPAGVIELGELVGEGPERLMMPVGLGTTTLTTTYVYQDVEFVCKRRVTVQSL